MNLNNLSFWAWSQGVGWFCCKLLVLTTYFFNYLIWFIPKTKNAHEKNICSDFWTNFEVKLRSRHGPIPVPFILILLYKIITISVMSRFKINNILFIEIIELNKNVYFLPDIYILQYNFRTQRVCHWLENNLVTLNSSWRKLHISNKFYMRSSHHMLTVLFVIFFYSTFSTPVVFNQVIYFCDTVLMFFMLV